MSGISRSGLDKATGVLGATQSSVLVNGVPAAVKGAPVAGHGSPPHATPTMVEASGTVFAEGIPVCRAGDKASCGHPSSGSGDVIAG